jgi:hypothetical protein
MLVASVALACLRGCCSVMRAPPKQNALTRSLRLLRPFVADGEHNVLTRFIAGAAVRCCEEGSSLFGCLLAKAAVADRTISTFVNNVPLVHGLFASGPVSCFATTATQAGTTSTALTYPLDLMRARMAAHWNVQPRCAGRVGAAVRVCEHVSSYSKCVRCGAVCAGACLCASVSSAAAAAAAGDLQLPELPSRVQRDLAR